MFYLLTCIYSFFLPSLSISSLLFLSVYLLFFFTYSLSNSIHTFISLSINKGSIILSFLSLFLFFLIVSLPLLTYSFCFFLLSISLSVYLSTHKDVYIFAPNYYNMKPLEHYKRVTEMWVVCP